MERFPSEMRVVFLMLNSALALWLRKDLPFLLSISRNSFQVFSAETHLSPSFCIVRRMYCASHKLVLVAATEQWKQDCSSVELFSL